MSFILYLVVLIVSVTSVMMGLDWISSPPRPISPPPVVESARAPAKPVRPVASMKSATVARPADGASKKAAVAKTETKVEAKQAVAASAALTGSQDGVAGTNATTSGAGTDALAHAGDLTADAASNGAAAPAPRCDVQACSLRYKTFRVSDCTYQPSDGPRRFCDKGHPPMQTNASDVRTSDARAPAASCNYQACAARYHSFDPATCTWQPYDGPRRLCEK